MTSARLICDAEIDVSTEICPMTYVRIRLALDRLTAGQHLRVTLRGAEALRNVPASALAHGHRITSNIPLGDGRSEIVIEKGGAPAGASSR